MGSGPEKVNYAVTALNECWCTEAHCPEILPFRHGIFQQVHLLLKQQKVTLLLQLLFAVSKSKLVIV